MTANQRRPGFRLPWAADTGEPTGQTDSATPAEASDSPAADQASTPAPTPAAEAEPTPSPEASGAETAEPGAGVPEPPTSADGADSNPTVEPVTSGDAVNEAPAAPEEASAPALAEEPAPTGDEFMRDLVAAMRRVADEARDHGMADLRARADEQVRKLEADADHRREDLRSRAEADVAAVGEWARAEAERIKAEAEQRVVARRAQLEQQLAGDQARTEAETKALRDRVGEYERELEAYHAQLAEISDPAAFAAAAKRMPKAPTLSGAPVATAPASGVPNEAKSAEAQLEPATAASNGVPAPAPEIHPAEEEVLAARLAELDATLPDRAAANATADTVTTEVIVKGLGSFGAITGFRQSLSGVDGVDGVALSLGQTGEFVFRVTHAAGFDLRAAIAALEGDGAKIEDRSEGGLRVTLDRAR